MGKPKTKSKPKTAAKAKPAATTNGAAPKADSIVITFEIFPPGANGMRTLIASGAPRNQMPELRMTTFAKRHEVLDELWSAILKRQPQVVAVPVTTESEEEADEGGADEDTTPESTGEATEETAPVSLSDEVVSAAEGTEQESPDKSSEPDEEEEQESEAAEQTLELTAPATEGAKPERKVWEQDPLPLIEGDPTSDPAGEWARESAGELIAMQANGTPIAPVD